MGVRNIAEKHDSISAIQFLVHEKYNSNGKQNNDIALLELETDAKLSGK
jgi:Trypsin